MTVYYAHCMAIYDTPQEQRDIQTLEEMGFEVINPADQKYDEDYAIYKESPDYDKDPMGFWTDLCCEFDIFAFRALPDGSIPSGVAAEMVAFRETGRPIFELPSCTQRRTLSYVETKQYLQEIGER